jgi:hypothetical protein
MKYKITAEYEDAHSITIISSMIVVDTEYTLGYKECKSEREVKDIYESLNNEHKVIYVERLKDDNEIGRYAPFRFF